MSKLDGNSKWHVDHIQYRLGYYRPFDAAITNLATNRLSLPESMSIFDAFMELIGEIERLQTELISKEK